MSYMYELLLVSQSPRRRELLEKAGYVFRFDTVKVSEIIDENVNLPDAISKLARSKAEAYIEFHKGSVSLGNLILSADTVVVLDDEILGKPVDEAEACQFLRRLSGRSHEVMTGISLIELDVGRGFGVVSGRSDASAGGGSHANSGRGNNVAGEKRSVMATEISKVRFRDLTDQEIRDYVATGEPMDKAGAYGIQGLGSKLVAGFEGSWSNVVGLPMELLERVLLQNNWPVQKNPAK